MSRWREKTNIYVSVDVAFDPDPPSVLLFMSLTNVLRRPIHSCRAKV